MGSVQEKGLEMRLPFALLTAVAIASLGVACVADTKAETRLEISVLTGDKETRRFDLECGPAGGNAPDPAGACAMLRAHPEMLDVPEATSTCAGTAGIPAEVTVEGESRGRLISLSVRDCDAPDARAASARLWLGALAPRS